MIPLKTRVLDPKTQAQALVILSAIGRALLVVTGWTWWFVREQGVTVVWMSLVVTGAAMWFVPAGLVVSGVCLWALHEKVFRDLR